MNSPSNRFPVHDLRFPPSWLPALALLLFGISDGLSQFPPNDLFREAHVLQGNPAVAAGTNQLASREPVEPRHAGIEGGRSVWYQWTPPRSGPATIRVQGGSFSTLLAVYTGDQVFSLRRIAQGLGYFGNVSLVFKATEKTTYKIAVDGENGAQGVFVLSASLNDGGAILPNDLFKDRIVLSESSHGPTTVSGSLRDAGLELHEPPRHAPALASVWYEWNPTRSDAFELRLAGAFSRVQLYQGDSLLGLTPVTPERSFVDQGINVIRFHAPSPPYQIAILERSAVGGDFEMEIHSDWPRHDSAATPVYLTSEPVTIEDSNVRASSDPADPPPAPGASGKTLWYSWRASKSGASTIIFSGLEIAAMMSLFRPGEQEAIRSLEASRGKSASLSLYARKGERFLFRFDSRESSGGAFQFQLEREPSAFDRWVLAFPDLSGDDAREEADPDRDGFTNLEEMAYGLHPLLASHRGGRDPESAFAPQWTKAPDGWRLSLTFSGRNWVAFAGWPEVQIEQSRDLLSWETLGPPVAQTGLSTTLLQRPVADDSGRHYYRLKVRPSTLPGL